MRVDFLIRVCYNRRTVFFTAIFYGDAMHTLTALNAIPIVLGNVVTAESFENQLASFYSIHPQKIPLLLNFEKVEYIDIAALSNCIAVLVHRFGEGFETYISYPRSKEVRDFLSVWRFPQAVEDIIKIPFQNILVPDQVHYLNEKQTKYTGIGDGIDALEYDPDWDGTRTAKRNFFEFSTFAAKEGIISPLGSLSSTPRSESKRWATTLIKEVLRTHLGSDAPRDDVARVIIYEILSNAVRHPNAHTIQTVSKFIRTDFSQKAIEPVSQGKLKKIEGNLRICVWDDGDFLAHTLLTPLEAGKTVRVFRFPDYMYDKTIVQVRDFGEKIIWKGVVDHSRDPNKDSPEYYILLSSLFPGISRSASEPVAQVPQYEEDEVSSKKNLVFSYGMPGMGLFALAKTVLDQFNGTIFIRSGGYRLIMELAHDAFRVQYNVRYKCKITSYPKYFPMFRGNLIVVQLPIRANQK
jgi:hypothetical protein